MTHEAHYHRFSDRLLVWIVEDMTEMKAAQQALRDAEANYRFLVETSSDLIAKVDLEGRFTFLNAARKT